MTDHAPLARRLALASLSLAVALAVAPQEAAARSVFGRLWHLLTDAPASKAVEAKPNAAVEGATGSAPSRRWPKEVEAPHGQTVQFPNPHAKGRLGDRLTALRLAGLGYKKLPSKYDGLHGIDGVYVKMDAKGEIAEIRVVESKVDRAQLNPGPPAQMSDEWLRQACAKMLAQGDTATAETARLILDHLDSPKLKRELWHHDLASGKTSVRAVDGRGKAQAVTATWDDKLIGNEIERQCAVALLVCN